MKEIELKIGNIILVDNEKYHPNLKNIPMVVKSISRNYNHKEGYKYYCELDKLNPDKYEWENYSQYLKFIKSIPLTKEWFLKFGFISSKNPNGDDIYHIINKDEFSENFTVQHFTSKEDKSKYKNHFHIFDVKRKIKYVHELQNLYYWKEGKELIIKK